MKHNDALVSIVLPTYNGEKYVEEQVRSLLEQTYRHLEIIVVDDRSTDRTLEIVRRLAAEDGRIQVHANPENLGLFANYLRGAARAKGEFVCVCDHDDTWRKDRVEILKDLLEKDDRNMMSYSDIEVCDEHLNFLRSSMGLTETRLNGGWLREKSLLKNVTTHMMIRKKANDLLVKVTDDAPFAHDHLMLILSAGLGRVVYSKEVLIKYRQHASNAIGAFYPSVIGKERVIKELAQKIAYLRQPPFKGLDLDLGRLERFSASLRSRSLFKRAPFIDYFLFLRNNTPVDKALGCLECLLPALYDWLSSKKQRPITIAEVR